MKAGRLKIGDLYKVKNELWNARTKWKDLGLELLISPDTLEATAIKYHGDPGNCLREMLADWLKGSGEPPRTWSSIVSALKKVDTLGAIAEEIEAKFSLADEGSATKPTVSRASVPTMYYLTKWKVISTVSAQWRQLADLLNINPSITAAIDGKHSDPCLACREIFTRWLKGEGTHPTWDVLLEALDDLDFKVLTKGLREALD